MAKPMPKTCSVHDCTRPHQARGYCTTHYSQWQRSQPGYKRGGEAGRRDRMVEIICEYCESVKLIRAHHAKAQRYCSLKCCARANKSTCNPGEWPTYSTDIVVYTGPKHQPRQVETIQGKGLWTAGQCRICTTWFVSNVLDVTCSKDCQYRHYRNTCNRAKERRRARKRNGYVADVYRKRVFELDAYKCHLCGRRCDPTKSVPHPRAPTVDHVIPLAAGGTHEPANCRTACFRCNAIKGDRGGGEQLALLG